MLMIKRYSLRGRLLKRAFWLLTAIFLVLLIGGAQYARQVADLSYDRLLNSASLSVLERIGVVEDQVQVDLPFAALAILELAPDDRVFYRVGLHADNQVLTGYADLPLPMRYTPSETPTFYNATYNSERLRLVVQSKWLATPQITGWVDVIVAQTRTARSGMMWQLLLSTFVPLIIVLVLVLVVVRASINHVTAPVTHISEQLRLSGSHENPEPLPETPVKELAPLVLALNSYQSQLQQNIERMREFIADTSHQIRTALAQTQAQLDMATHEQEAGALKQRLTRIRAQHNQLTRLTNQLLAHALVMHRKDSQPLELINVDQFLRQILTQCVRDHAHTDIEFSYSAGDKSAEILGDRVSLREALSNVLDNAMNYGPTDNHIDLNYTATSTSIIIQIDDSGPGIPLALREDALTRFKRLQQTGQGSGLGLSIVKSVTELFGGQLTLEDSPLGGLRVALEFKRVTG